MFNFILYFELTRQFQTDDFGVFGTTLSKEIQIASDTFDLSFKDLVKLSITAIASSFSSDEEKTEIRGRIEKFAEDNLPEEVL